jgi:hypothetical protein
MTAGNFRETTRKKLWALPQPITTKEQSMKRVNKLAAGIFLLSQTLSGAAFAASVTLAGTTVDFSFDDALLGLFGQANVTGDSLYLTPTHFTAEALNGAGFDLTKQTVNIKVSAHAGWDFSSIALTERGDYLRVGEAAKLAVSGQIRVFDTAQPLAEVTSSILPAGAFQQTDDFISKNWNANAVADMGSMSAAGMINVTLQNILVAQSPSGTDTLAFIEKKFVGLTPVTVPVPEADTYAMMLAGLGLVGFAVRRRATV